MRLSVLPALATLSVGIMACAGEPLTGPTAQAAYSRAAERYPNVPGNVQVVVDGRRMPAGQRLDRLDPKTIQRIEIVKGDAAVRLYGEAARTGVIRIYTKNASTPAEPSGR